MVRRSYPGHANRLSSSSPQPVTLAVESEGSADRWWNFDGVGWIIRWRMGNRRYDHRYVAILVTGSRDDNRAGPIFRALLRAGILLMAPEKAVADHQARLCGRKCHSSLDARILRLRMSAMTSALRAPTSRTCRSRALSLS